MCARTVRRHLNHNAGYTLIELLLTCLVLLILTAVIAPTAWYYINKADARAVLTEAKTARLAAYVTSLDCYANGSPFQDQSMPNGFAKGVEEKVAELAECPGEIYLLQYGPAAGEIRSMAYREKSFVAVYTLDEDGEHWNVYKTNHMIVH